MLLLVYFFSMYGVDIPKTTGYMVPWNKGISGGIAKVFIPLLQPRNITRPHTDARKSPRRCIHSVTSSKTMSGPFLQFWFCYIILQHNKQTMYHTRMGIFYFHVTCSSSAALHVVTQGSKWGAHRGGVAARLVRGREAHTQTKGDGAARPSRDTGPRLQRRSRQGQPWWDWQAALVEITLDKPVFTRRPLARAVPSPSPPQCQVFTTEPGEKKDIWFI